MCGDFPPWGQAPVSVLPSPCPLRRAFVPSLKKCRADRLNQGRRIHRCRPAPCTRSGSSGSHRPSRHPISREGTKARRHNVAAFARSSRRTRKGCGGACPEAGSNRPRGQRRRRPLVSFVCFVRTILRKLGERHRVQNLMQRSTSRRARSGPPRPEPVPKGMVFQNGLGYNVDSLDLIQRNR